MLVRSVTHSIYFAFQKPNRSQSRACFYFQRTYNSISRSSRSKSRASVSARRIPTTGNSDALSRIKIDSGLTEKRAAKLRDRLALLPPRKSLVRMKISIRVAEDIVQSSSPSLSPRYWTERSQLSGNRKVSFSRTSIFLSGKNFQPEDVGRWTCVVGLTGESIQEVSTGIDINTSFRQSVVVTDIVIGASILLAIAMSFIIFTNFRKKRSATTISKLPPPYNVVYINGIPSKSMT